MKVNSKRKPLKMKETSGRIKFPENVPENFIIYYILHG